MPKTYRDADGKRIKAGCWITFSYGIPPRVVVGPVVRKGNRLFVLTEGHNPSECPLSELEDCVGYYWLAQEPATETIATE